MNYEILFCGQYSDTFDTVCKLFLETAEESDYMVKTFSFERLSPYGYRATSFSLNGSSKKDLISIIVDFDNVYCGEQKNIYLNPHILGIIYEENGKHCWGVTASLFRIVQDLSPAFITGYLLDRRMDNEQNIFKHHLSASLPFRIQEKLK